MNTFDWKNIIVPFGRKYKDKIIGETSSTMLQYIIDNKSKKEFPDIIEAADKELEWRQEHKIFVPKLKCLRCKSRFTGRRHNIGYSTIYYIKAGLKPSIKKHAHLCIHCYNDIFKLNWSLRQWFWNLRGRTVFDNRNTLQEYKILVSIEEELWRFFLTIQKDTIKREAIFTKFLTLLVEKQREEEKLKTQYDSITKSSTITMPGMSSQ